MRRVFIERSVVVDWRRIAFVTRDGRRLLKTGNLSKMFPVNEEMISKVEPGAELCERFSHEELAERVDLRMDRAGIRLLRRRWRRGQRRGDGRSPSRG